MVRLHLATTQGCHVVKTTFEMDSVVTNVNVHTLRQEEKITGLLSSANGPFGAPLIKCSPRQLKGE